ncbi:hypothetical protein JG688_00003719 [Phytophthora aleatoria]|uniref:Suppressor of forked domain-containing protein n=1 Tax=Phytophthora aleatoria TaxID=2496075 RepID=A0A8J5JA63_9STRA|nr:hypothetical protein JG688_00003719 [Phytophthora aleatoria]
MMATLPPTADVTMIDGALFEYEEEATRQPFAVQTWTSYLRALSDAPLTDRCKIYERGLQSLPRSYKLWKRYLDDVYETQVRGQRVDSPLFTQLVALYERALAQLSTMPRLWLDYLNILREMRVVTARRHVFDRALRALPITQHHRIWTPYLAFVKQMGVPRTAVGVYRRYLMLEPSKRGEFVDYLVSVEHYEEASLQLVKLIESTQEKETSTDRTQHSMWMKLCDMVSQHPTRVAKSLDVEAILRSGMTRFSDEVGRLWCSLATYFVRLGMFESARDVYEEGIRTVVTVRDFSMIFDAYVKFIEAMLTAEMDLAAGGDDEDDEEEDEVDHQAQVDRLLKVYEDHGDLNNARAIFKKAVDVEFRNPQELAAVYCEWAEVELRHENFDEALEIVRGACAIPASRTIRLRKQQSLSAKDNVHLSVKLWTLRLDLEESLGDLESTRAAYGEVFELKIITPQMVLNFAAYLEENKYFEESFRVHERGLALFPKFPHAGELWQTYLTKFVKRYAGTKMERTRDLFEQAIRAAPAKSVRGFYEKFADFEEQHGMLRNVMTIYERASDAVPDDDKLSIYEKYIKKAQKFFGVAKVRDVYQRGISKLPDKCVPNLCLKFAQMETKLGEFDRARAIYAHASQFCDPRQHEKSFWKVWHEFEVSHGSEHTFLEMLRIKRSVKQIVEVANEEEIDLDDEDDDTEEAAGGEPDVEERELPGEEDYGDDFVEQDDEENDELETDVAETLFDLVDLVEAAIAEEEKIIVPSPRTVSTRPRSSMGRTTKYVLRIQSVFRGYRARIAFRLALYEDALSCGVLGAMPGTIQGRSGWYLDPKRLIAYYFVIPDPDGEWKQKYTLRCSRLVLTPYEMRQEVLSKAPAGLVQSEPE